MADTALYDHTSLEGEVLKSPDDIFRNITLFILKQNIINEGYSWLTNVNYTWEVNFQRFKKEYNLQKMFLK